MALGNLAVSGIEIYGAGRNYPLEPGNYMAQIGDVAVYERVIITPMGTWPMMGSQWLLAQQPHLVRKTSTFGVVCTVISCVLAALTFWWTCGLGLLFLFGLFFLKDKVSVLEGPAIIVIRSGHNIYQAQEFIQSPNQLPWLINKVNYCQAIAASAR